MTLLESSGIVDFAALPVAPNPAAGGTAASAAKPVPAASQSQTSTTNLPVALLSLAAGLGVGVFATLRLAGNRRPHHRRR
jgi:hypothetical protein